MSALSLLWVLVVCGHVFDVSSKSTTTLKKRQQVPSSAAGNFLLHSSLVVNDDTNEVKRPWRAHSPMHKNTKSNNHDRRIRYLRKGNAVNKMKRKGPFSAEKHHVVLRNEAIRNREILIDNGDEVWPKVEEEHETRGAETEDNHLGRKLNFYGSHNEKNEDEINSHKETVFENNILQVDSTGLHDNEVKNGSSNGGRIEINTSMTEQASRVGGVKEADTLLNMTNLRENAPKESSFENATSGHGLEADGGMRNSSTVLEYGHKYGEGTTHIKHNPIFVKAVPQQEGEGYSSNPIREMEYQSVKVQSTNNGLNLSEQRNMEHEDASKDHGNISLGSIERPNYYQRQTYSHKDANLGNMSVQGFPQVEEQLRTDGFNQKMRVVHFVKMATGIPLYHEKTIPDSRKIQQRVNNSNLRSDSGLHQPNRSAQVLLEQQHGDEHRQSLTVDVSETNKEMQGKKEWQDEQISHKPLIPNSDHVSMQANTDGLNQTTTLAPMSNVATETKPGLPQEQTVQEPQILNGPNVDLTSSEDVEDATVNSRPWASWFGPRQSRFSGRNRYRNVYGNTNNRYRRPNGGNRGGWEGDNTGGSSGGAAEQGGAGGGMVPGSQLRGSSGGRGGTTGSPAAQTVSVFEEDALEAHNKFRKVHIADAMRLDRDLSNQAKGYAQKIASMHNLTHSSGQERGEDVGENLAYACKMNGVPLTGNETVKMWYDEACDYDFNRGGFGVNTGHFTQVVWTDSLDLGMGMAETSEDGMNCIYVVGRYRKPGNVKGQFSDKVLRGNFVQSYCNNVKKG